MATIQVGKDWVQVERHNYRTRVYAQHEYIGSLMGRAGAYRAGWMRGEDSIPDGFFKTRKSAVAYLIDKARERKAII
jgi:hypothetical protein